MKCKHADIICPRAAFSLGSEKQEQERNTALNCSCSTTVFLLEKLAEPDSVKFCSGSQATLSGRALVSTGVIILRFVVQLLVILRVLWSSTLWRKKADSWWTLQLDAGL